MEDFFEKNHDIKKVSILKDSLNSKIFNVIFKGEESILKKYKSNNLNRINREISALNLLKKNNYPFTPEILFYEKNYKYIIISTLKGNIPKQNYNFINKMAVYCNDMQSYIPKNDLNIKFASEAAFSIFDHISLVTKKLKYLSKKINENDKNYFFESLIKSELIPRMSQYIEILDLEYDIKEEILIEDKIFSQSDLGAHNTFIKNNVLFTFDYEYSGIDDPAKTICDLLIHPENILSENSFCKLINNLSSIKIFKTSLERAKILMPIYRYKWFGIILNGYIKNIQNKPHQAKESLKKSINYLESTKNKIKKVNRFNIVHY